MKNRPLLIVLLGVLHLLEPIFKVFYFKTKTHFDLVTILSNLTYVEISSLKGLVDFWLVFPIAGLALLSVKRIAWYFFISIQFYSIITHLTYQRFAWPYFAEVPFFSSVFLLIMNFILIIYICLPEVRMLFFEKSNRWWETRTRYAFTLPIKLWHTNPEKLEQACLLNLSETGALIRFNRDIDLKEFVHLEISFQDIKVQVKGLIVRDDFRSGQKSYGIKFVYDTPVSINKFKLKKIVRELHKLHKVGSNITIVA
ncbi:MAG: PilZ domain-containing protein [Bacteriovoracaceae bacterium]|nr:PilZ domain-containing protein [Bacteriovoracaceae bacterium]